MDMTVTNKIKQDLIGTGIFLEADTYQLYKKWTKDRIFTVHREYVYNYNRGRSDLNGTIDVLAETSISSKNIVLMLPIECKKADPKLKHWVFDPHRADSPRGQELFLSVKDGESHYSRIYNLPSLGYNTYSDYENSVNVFEFSKDDGKLNRNREKDLKPYYAMKQVNEAVPGVVGGLPELSRNTSFSNVIIPLVVTTANLWVTDYDPAKISKEEGDIPVDELNLKPKDWVVYSYPLSFHEELPGGLDDEGGERINPSKRFTFIVKSSALELFTEKLISDLERYYN